MCAAGKLDDPGRNGAEGGSAPYQRRDHLYELLKTKLDVHELPALLFNSKEMFVIVLQRGWDAAAGEIPLVPCLIQFQEELEREEGLSFRLGSAIRRNRRLGCPTLTKKRSAPCIRATSPGKPGLFNITAPKRCSSC